MLQSDFFDKETEALIDLNVIYGAGKHITDKCMIIFSKEIHTYLVSHYKCEIIGEIGACNGNISIYCLDYKGEKIAFYLTGIGSAVASSMCMKAIMLLVQQSILCLVLVEVLIKKQPEVSSLSQLKVIEEREHPIITHHLLTTLLLKIVMCWQRYLKK